MKDLMAASDAMGFAKTHAEGLRCLLLDASESPTETTPETLETLSDVAASIRDDCARALDALGVGE